MPRVTMLISRAKRAQRMPARFLSDNSGATAIEYAVMTFIAVAVIAVVSQLGGSVNAMYERVQQALATF